MSSPSQAATGTLANSAHEVRSDVIITGRRGIRSTSAPAGRLTSSQGSQEAALRMATRRGSASKVMTAVKGVITVVTELPTLLTVVPNHSRREPGSLTTLSESKVESAHRFVPFHTVITSIPGRKASFVSRKAR